MAGGGTAAAPSRLGSVVTRALGPWNRYARPKPAATTAAPPTASSTQWLPVATMAATVKRGWSSPRAFIHILGAMTAIATPHHSDQPKCSEGIAAYWLVRCVSVP